MERAVGWAFSAAVAGTLVALGLSMYLYGVPRSFPLFLLRSVAVMGLTFTLVFAITVRFSPLD